MPFRLIRANGGFTLIELIVSISILAMLSMAFLRQSEMTAQKHKNQEYINAIETVMASLRTARTNAITSKITKLPTIPETLGVPPGGYGTHIEILRDSNEIKIFEFADTHDSAGNGTADGIYNKDYDMTFNEKTLKTFWLTTIEEGTFVPDVIPPTPSDSELTVIFLPGDAEMNINDNFDAVANAYRKVGLVFNYNGLPKRMCLNRVSRFIETISGNSC